MKAVSVNSKRLLAVLTAALVLPQPLLTLQAAQAREQGQQAVQTALAAAGQAANPAASASSEVSGREASKAVDGDAATYWQPSSTDREDMNVWLSVDLGRSTSVNKAVFSLNRADNLASYAIEYSSDGLSWHTACSRNQPPSKDENAYFEEVTARYFRLNLTLGKNLNVNVFDFQLMKDVNSENPVPSDLKRIYFANDVGQEVPINGELTLQKDAVKTLNVKGVTSSGSIVPLPGTAVSWISAAKSIEISPDGTVKALKTGAAMVNAEVTVNGVKIKSPDFWIVVEDPAEFEGEAFIAGTSLSHPTLRTEIGQPAILSAGEALPAIGVRANTALTLSGEVRLNGSPAAGITLPVTAFGKGQRQTVPLTGQSAVPGLYEIRLTFSSPGRPDYHDTFSFTVPDETKAAGTQSSIAFLGESGKMTYVPDFKGNRILDFSGSGYKGGGVPIPNVQAKAVVSPGEGDDTRRIQDAIDAVSQMPPGPDGFRGAVLLTKGRFEVSGTLKITAGGVVLRGEGRDAGGTVLLGTGATARNLVEIGGTSGVVTDNASKTAVTDLYVPSGAVSFHVADASAYKAGDKVVVRRIGSARFIHEIGMDHIYMRPGQGGTQQWGAFNLDFDRTVTKVEGSRITLDVPLANSIDLKWGGGELYKYSDAGRIEQVGVENMRVDSEFDKSIIDTVMDNGKTDPYYADENHAERFVVFNSVKNGWLREVTTTHLSYATALVGRQAKWITVQDTTTLDMVSIITGGRRYAIHFQGQQSLAQRNHVETSRHAFVVDSRVQGPNVFLDGTTDKNFNTSEPHHKWSVGGLYDNIQAPISIRDRAWLGSGHGWSGANYVTWNTEGALTSQQPPTAQNYAIGHVGTVVPGLVPSTYDPRPRSEAFWESTGAHVTPVSLYKQQLLERKGPDALQFISRLPLPSGSLNQP
ncbi:discoidin domain-containing protein [Paenibacillus sp. UNC499MF]|uniref:discoidin domain-containing protein n=1 Tax=Paenibacillus sp. UNC499MF TaxID=1502751 RepID=UPI0008A05272|nr:discoidin domain-containing protein [Paenibacillus sp. UNC499MF]SEG09242.1 F5/8 type C domain-containing protein [Paenibacillus sp. UNC499MF]